MGLYFVKTPFSSDVNSGTTLDIFILLGNTPISLDEIIT